MREQVVMQRAGRGGGGSTSAEKWRGAGGQAQRPAKRRGGAGAVASPAGRGWRSFIAWMPLVGKLLIVIVVCVIFVSAYRVASSAAFFQLRHVDISGTVRTSPEPIQAIVRRHAAGGVWKADLAAISTEIERQQGWVREAVVTRVLPDGLRVRVREREPRAVWRTSSGRLVWVDNEAVTLGEVAAGAALPPFFVYGLDEANVDAARRENRERVKRYLEMSRAWGEAGISERVSEVNLMDLRDVRAQLAGADARIEVRLGKEDFGPRLARALRVLDEQRRTPRGALITRLDTTLERRVIVGFSTGAQEESGGGSAGPGRSR